MQRREVLKAAVAGAAALVLGRSGFATSRPAPIVDAHIHLFDPRRAGGVPWPEKSDTALYKPALPGRYEGIARGFGVVGAIAIEASPWPSDNAWLLGVVARHPVMVGAVGDLDPALPTYSRELDTFHRNPLFLGIRYGNLWGRDLMADLDKPGFVDGLKALAQAGLALESANPDARLMRALRRAGERVPELRIVADHLPNANVPATRAAQEDFHADLRRLAENPRVFVKLSEIPVRAQGRLVTDPGAYKAGLDGLWDVFGEDHVLFGSDWPNSDHVATFAETLAIVRGYMAQKSAEAQAKYYWKNSLAAYRWKRRRTDQPEAFI